MSYFFFRNHAPRFRVGLMTEHLDGSYPTLKFRKKQARDDGQKNAHVNDMWPFRQLSYWA